MYFLHTIVYEILASLYYLNILKDACILSRYWASSVFLVPAWRRTLVSLSASSTDPDHPPTSAKGEGHPSEMSALE